MHNYYFAAGAQLDAVGAGLVAGRLVHLAVAMSGSIWNVDPRDRAARDELTYDRKYPLDARLVARRALDRRTSPTMAAQTIQLEIVNVATGETPRADDPTRTSTWIRCSLPTARASPTCRRSRTETSTSSSGRSRTVSAPATRSRSRATTISAAIACTSAAMDMHITPAWLPDGKRAAAGLEPQHAAWLRQRAARARGRERDRQGDDGAGGADAVSHAAARLARRQALRLLLDSRRGGPVQQPVRAADRGRRAVQADLLPARRLSSALVAGRRVDRVHLQRGRPAAARSCSRRTAARSRTIARDRAPLEAADGRRCRCGRSTRRPVSRPRRASISPRRTASTTRRRTRTRG